MDASKACVGMGRRPKWKFQWYFVERRFWRDSGPRRARTLAFIKRATRRVLRHAQLEEE